VDETIATKLMEVNHTFYQKLGKHFSATRSRLQPGVKKVAENLLGESAILDLGCGNGKLAYYLTEHGFSGSYVGLDSSREMLAEARQKTAANHNTSFFEVDISKPDWHAEVNFPETSVRRVQYNAILAFAVLHHIPGKAMRFQLLREIHPLLSHEGMFILSVWQFLNSARLVKKIQPWQLIGLEPADVDQNDYLLDWQQGEYGLRYVHFFNEDELAELAELTQFEISSSYHSDGEGGNLGLYQAWKPINNP
jgi:tRNA (uracil-5-)-methyltransferase TRM9